MKYFVDKNSKEAAYMQLYHQLRRDIISGALPLGSRLPSKRTLAGALELSLVTVEHAYALLLDEGRIYSDILERTGASSATISRVNRSLQYGADGYAVAFKRLKEQEAQGK